MRPSVVQWVLRWSRLRPCADAWLVQSCARPALRRYHNTSPTSDSIHATDVKEGHGDRGSILRILEERGLINQIAGERDGLETLLQAEPRVGVYAGIDPTAPSLHVGHLIPLMALFWMYAHGYTACCLVGGSTGLIGDPSGRSSARAKQGSDQIIKNTKAIMARLREIWQNGDEVTEHWRNKRTPSGRFRIHNNAQWHNTVNFIDIMRNLGTHMKIGAMLGRDSVKQRLSKGDSISLAEFSYPLFQAWDWCVLYRIRKVRIQIGGSDQYGNILAGMDAVNHMRKNNPRDMILSAKDTGDEIEAAKVNQAPMGLTTPLLTTSSGAKFGKSEGNAIWLNKNMTRPFEFYQFFLSVADSDVKRYLKLFTFLPLEDIDRLMHEHEQDQSKRVAQHALALEVTKIVHGPHIAALTEKNHRGLFDKDGEADGAKAITPGAPSIPLPRSLLDTGLPFARLLFHTAIIDSMTEARHIVSTDGVYAGRFKYGKLEFERVSHIKESSKATSRVDWSPYILQDNTMIIRKGKKTPRIIRLLSDKTFVDMKTDFPGSDRWWNDICEKGLAKNQPRHAGP